MLVYTTRSGLSEESVGMSETILLIEDNEADVVLLEYALERVSADIAIQTISDGEAARDYLATLDAPPRVVLLDLNLPKVDGLTLLAQIRRTPALKDVAVVVWSSSKEPASVRTAQDLGVVDFLLKPMDLAEWLKLAVTVCSLLTERPETV